MLALNNKTIAAIAISAKAYGLTKVPKTQFVATTLKAYQSEHDCSIQ